MVHGGIYDKTCTTIFLCCAPLVVCWPKRMSQNGVRKAATEDKEHGVAQKSPINNVANRW